MEPLIKTEYAVQPQIGDSQEQGGETIRVQQVGRSVPEPPSPMLMNSSRQAIFLNRARPRRQLARKRLATTNGRLCNKRSKASMTDRHLPLAPHLPPEQHIFPLALRSNLDMPRYLRRLRLYRATMKSLPPRHLAHNKQSREMSRPLHKSLHHVQSKFHITCPHLNP